MQRIAVDMDGVLANVYQQFIAYHHRDTGEMVPIEAAIGKPESEVFPTLRPHLYEAGFFRGLTVMEGSQEILRQLYVKYEVFIVSAATEFPQSLPEKQAWLQEHFSFIPWQRIVFCGAKTIIQADIMIDDHFKNLDHFTGTTLLFSQPHNQLAPEGRHRRVNSWAEIAQLLL